MAWRSGTGRVISWWSISTHETYLRTSVVSRDFGSVSVTVSYLDIKA